MDGFEAKIARLRQRRSQWEIGLAALIPPYRISAFERGAVELTEDEMRRLRDALRDREAQPAHEGRPA